VALRCRRSVDDPARKGTARRQLTLVLPTGRKRSLPLQDGGGHAGNNALNLYHLGKDRFLLVSQRDCVRIDSIKGQLQSCERTAACAAKRQYVGRFDWMNAFDPPRGEFRFGFRFLPGYDAWENGGC
jgi:hypothetical protein